MEKPTSRSDREPEGNLDAGAMEAVLVGQANPEIVALEAQMRAAQLAGDVAALERLIHSDLLFTGPTGQVGSKAEDLEAHRSGFFRFRSHEPEELRIRKIGPDIAVIALRARLSVEVAGTLHEGVYRYTRVWAREDGQAWRVVAGHVSDVPQQSDGPRE